MIVRFCYGDESNIGSIVKKTEQGSNQIRGWMEKAGEARAKPFCSIFLMLSLFQSLRVFPALFFTQSSIAVLAGSLFAGFISLALAIPGMNKLIASIKKCIVVMSVIANNRAIVHSKRGVYALKRLDCKR